MNELMTPAEAEEDNVSALERPAVFSKLKDWFADDDNHNRPFRKQAEKDYAFYCGKQLSQADHDKMISEGRQPVIFNRTMTIVNAVSGIEIGDRTEAIFYPTDPQDEGEVEANELLSAGAHWMGDQCDAEQQQSRAFKLAFICGASATEARVDYEESPKGKYDEDVVNIQEFRWDCNARQQNLTDSGRFFRARTMPISDARSVIGDSAKKYSAGQIHAHWADDEEPEEGKSREEKRKRLSNLTDETEGKNSVTLVHAQWIEHEPYIFVELDPVLLQMFPIDPSMQTMELTPEEFEQFSESAARNGIPESLISHVEMRRKVWKQAYLGAEGILGEVQDAPCKKHCNWNFITYELDEKGMPFGGVSVMRDPQMFANKWLTQTLHILNTTAKGGIIAEEDAFVNWEEAAAIYAMPQSMVKAARGAISKSKIMQKPGGGLSAPYLQLTEFAISSIRDCVGVSLELLGMRDATQAGVLEHQRKQAGLTILAGLFDNFKLFRKTNARVRLYYIQEYFSDGRLIRVAGDHGKQIAMRLIKDKTFGDYDVEIDDAPTSPNMREMNWRIILDILPAIREQITPRLMLMILEYSPLPAKLVQAFKKELEEPTPQQQAQESLEIAGAEAEINKTEAEAEKARATAESAKIKAVTDLMLAFGKMQTEQLSAMQQAPQAQPASNTDIERVLAALSVAQPETIQAQTTGFPQVPQLQMPPAVLEAPIDDTSEII